MVTKGTEARGFPEEEGVFSSVSFPATHIASVACEAVLECVYCVSGTELVVYNGSDAQFVEVSRTVLFTESIAAAEIDVVAEDKLLAIAIVGKLLFVTADPEAPILATSIDLTSTIFPEGLSCDDSFCAVVTGTYKVDIISVTVKDGSVSAALVHTYTQSYAYALGPDKQYAAIKVTANEGELCSGVSWDVVTVETCHPLQTPAVSVYVFDIFWLNERWWVYYAVPVDEAFFIYRLVVLDGGVVVEVFSVRQSEEQFPSSGVWFSDGSFFVNAGGAQTILTPTETALVFKSEEIVCEGCSNYVFVSGAGGEGNSTISPDGDDSKAEDVGNAAPFAIFGVFLLCLVVCAGVVAYRGVEDSNEEETPLVPMQSVELGQ